MEQLKERKVFSLSIRQQDPRTMLLLTDKTCNSKSCFGLIGGVQCAAYYPTNLAESSNYNTASS